MWEKYGFENQSADAEETGRDAAAGGAERLGRAPSGSRGSDSAGRRCAERPCLRRLRLRARAPRRGLRVASGRGTRGLRADGATPVGHQGCIGELVPPACLGH
ncbi:unnamed protein product [Prorocentrum cordatum]|uniref:Uncharacterized protein n=1 Tax=Prorocentrum cordatum TaxID=2364126 RepID=A0ABN9W629_9DINO|nr:unnamed protein product [Polarella glacialis]